MDARTGRIHACNRAMAARVDVTVESLVPAVPEEPYQPLNYSFPRREFGQKTTAARSFQSSWFIKWKWLHYDAIRDLVFCHMCVTGVNSSKLKLTGNAKESAFIYGGIGKTQQGVSISMKQV